ncbi:MAG: glycosyltransferase family 39 protein [Candidatus Komeilibacteria bacterium]|nr:glycosyltransferase family 39 protein [Candidatus Komeilibacteria bacterium]
MFWKFVRYLAATLGVIVFTFSLKNLYLHTPADLIIFLTLFITIVALIGLLRITATSIRTSVQIPVWALPPLFWASIVFVSGGILLFYQYPVDIFSYAALAGHVFIILCVYGLFAVVCYVFGHRILKLIGVGIPDTAGDLLASIVLGVVGTIVFFYGVTLLHLVSVTSVVVFCIFFIILGLPSFPSLLRHLCSRLAVTTAIRSFRLTNAGTILLLAFVFGAALFISNAYYMPFDGDSLRTYYNVPQLFVANGGMVAFPYDALNNAALASSFLYIPIIVIGASYLTYINAFLFIALLCSQWYAVKKYFSEKAAVLSCVVLCTIELIFFLAVSVKSEILLALIFLWACIFMAHFFMERRAAWAVLAGVLLGCAVAIKYTTLLALPGLILVFIVADRKQPLNTRVRDILLFAGAGMLMYAAWGIRLVARYGNVLYPFSISGIITTYGPRAAALYKYLESETVPVTHNIIGYISNDIWHNFAAVVTNASPYPNNRIGALLALLLPLAVWYRPRKGFIYLILFVVPTVALWYRVAPAGIWYIIYISPLLAAILGQYWSEVRGPRVRSFLALTAVLMLLLTIPTSRLIQAATFFAPRPSEGTLQFSTAGSIEAYAALTLAAADPSYVILPFGPIAPALIPQNNIHVVENLFLEFWVQSVAETQTPEETIQRLREQHITHIYVDNEALRYKREQICGRTACPTLTLLLARLIAVTDMLPVTHEEKSWKLYAIPSL